MMKLNFKKKQTMPKKQLTAQQFVNVSDIRGNILFSKDNQIFTYIKIQPVCIDLLSNNEKQMLIRNLSSELSSIDKPFKFFAISRPVDISSLIDEYMELYSNSDEEVQKSLLEQEIKMYKNFTLSGEVIERQFFLIIWENTNEDSEYSIGKRAKELVNKFRNCSIGADILNEDEIIQLCNFFSNPSYAHMEESDIDIGIPILKAKGDKE